MTVIHMNDWPPYAPSDSARREGTVYAARLMANAAQTAPKTGGVDQIECSIVYGKEEQEQIAQKMEELSFENPKNNMWYRTVRTEAVMTRDADCILFIGNYRAGDSPLDAGCGLCGGNELCSHVYSQRDSGYGQIDLISDREKNKNKFVNGPLCTIWIGDLGFAVGSALYLAKQNFVDNRPLFSVGIAGHRLGYCRDSSAVIGILLASAPKTPFYDVMPDYHMLTLDKAIKQLRKNYTVFRQVHWYNYKQWYPKHRQGKEEE